jgi:lipopolysaccharide biosynthesis glycosyltransferase
MTTDGVIEVGGMETGRTDKGELHVVTCADRRFAIGAWITIWSTYKYTPENHNLRFHLLTTDPSAPAFAKMMELAKRWGMKLSIKGAAEDAIKDLPTHRLPISSYLRLLAPRMLPGISEFLYLDADLLIRSSVQPLFHMLKENVPAAAVREYYFYDILGSKLQERSPELPKAAPYFNSGVIQVNVEAWRDRKVSERAIDYLDFYGPAVSHGDQDALNVVLVGELKELDLTWNVQLGAFEYFDRVGWPNERETLRVRKDELLREPKIVHFIGRSKPWSDGFTMPYGKQYRKMIAQSGWLPRGLLIPWKVGWLASTIRATVKRRLNR